MSASDGVAHHCLQRCCGFQLLRCQVVEVLPRVYPLVLGELEPRPPAAKTQGKAGNQLAALRLSTSSVSKKRFLVVTVEREREKLLIVTCC